MGTFKQVIAMIVLASVVSLPIMFTVDLLLPDPEYLPNFTHHFYHCFDLRHRHAGVLGYVCPPGDAW